MRIIIEAQVLSIRTADEPASGTTDGPTIHLVPPPAGPRESIPPPPGFFAAVDPPAGFGASAAARPPLVPGASDGA